jgi:hypothetical protein
VGALIERARRGATAGTARALALLVVGASLAACGGSPRAGERAYLKLECEPESASVYVDERYLASAKKLARRPAELRVGIHRVTVTAPGYFPHDVELELPAGETKVELTLRPIPP